jgi:hypothetical protein
MVQAFARESDDVGGVKAAGRILVDAVRIGNLDNQQPAGPQPTAKLREHGQRVGQVLENVKQRNDIE